MPFPDVTKHNVTRNFEQVLNAILQKSRILLKIEDLIPRTPTAGRSPTTSPRWNRWLASPAISCGPRRLRRCRPA